ncbi:hypothetical protein [Candidatus Ruthia endofausta]|nr:hypothetical protein [Candidatus Ruthia endofausta]
MFLIFAKLANVAVPVVLKEIVDSLEQTNLADFVIRVASLPMVHYKAC